MIDWQKVKFFKPTEAWGNPDKLNPALVYALDALRAMTGRKITINNAYRAGDDKEHGKGNAADIVIEGLSVIDQLIAAERTRLFTGIGIYPYWNKPGLHVDVRDLKPGEHGARWARNEKGVYVALDWAFIKTLK